MAITKSLGLVEIVGLAAAIEFADAALKAANVQLMGYELTNGGGYVTVKILGDVSAVQAAVSAGTAAASRVGKIVAQKVIPRPHKDLYKVVDTKETVKDRRAEPIPKENPSSDPGPTQSKAVLPRSDEPALDDEEQVVRQPEENDTSDEDDQPAKEPEAQLESEEELEEADELEEAQPIPEQLPDELQDNKASCNICGDPLCPRMKGEPRTLCIHNK